MTCTIYILTPYPDIPEFREHYLFNISKYDFSKYAILNGKYGKHVMSYDTKVFYASICKMAVKNDKGFFTISDDYACAETSYKNIISFAMGMLATRIIANKKYNISRLYHFTDCQLLPNLKRGKMAPDWFGLDQNNRPFLFESKGTIGKKMNLKTINRAYDQLENIYTVIEKSSGQKYSQSDISKHIMCSCFDICWGVDNVWHIHDIDPEGEGCRKIELQINIDKECFMYYQAFILYVDSLNVLYQKVTVKNKDYYCWTYRDEKYYILKEIYDMVKEKQFVEENMYRNFNKEINRYLAEMVYPEQFSCDISSYEDGIIVSGLDTLKYD